MEGSISVASSGIVHQLLTKDNNYKRWKTLMKNYLQGQGLWDVIDPPPAAAPPTPDIEKGLGGVVSEVEIRKMTKNAKALHIIQLSCGGEILDEISHFETAKDVWYHLSRQYEVKSKVKANTDITIASVDDSYGENIKLFKEVERGYYSGNIGERIYSKSASGRTLLHVAAIAGHVNVVEKLVKEGEDKLVNMKDERGYTALALVSHYTGNTEIAKCMVENELGEKLLSMQNSDGEIPVLLAAANGRKKMTTYLYSRTPQEVLKRDFRDRVLLLERCITARIFDVALKLLQGYPDLPRESRFLSVLANEFSVLDALANIPSAFPSGNRFGLREQFIYDILNVKREFQANYEKIPDFDNFVRSVTCVADEGRQKTSFGNRYDSKSKLCCDASLSSFCRMTLNFLFLSVNLFGGFCRLVLNFLLRPVKLLGQLLRGIVSVFVHIFKCLKISGIRDIYDQKYTHYEVLGILYYFCRSISDFNQSQLLEASAYDAMLRAAQHGITEFIKAMGMANSVLLSASDEFKRGIFSHAILNRKQNVFQLLHGLDERKELFDFYKDIFGNNLLHLAAHLGPLYDPDSRPGAALQMQREIQWFKAVEELVHPVCKEVRNYDGRKPHELFTETHEELVKDGEKWAKGTAKSLTLVGILITTIVFAAAFTVPGGYNQESGVPIFLHDKLFIAFLITDAISLFTSAASVLIFAGILTSRYAEKDFLTSLPSKLLFGLSFLFLSVIFMIVAFGAALVVTILKGYRSYRWFVIGPTLFLGSVPLVVLVVSQWGLMYEIFQSTRKNPISYI